MIPERVVRVPDMFEGRAGTSSRARSRRCRVAPDVQLQPLDHDERGHARRDAGGRDAARAVREGLRDWGFEPIDCPFWDFETIGGGFHCASVDIRRRGSLRSYF